MMWMRLAPERLAQADLRRPLGDHHQHDVHDHDAADDERQRDHADEHREDVLRDALVERQERLRAEDPEVVLLASASAAACDPQGHPRLLHRRPSSATGATGFDRQQQRLPAAEELPQRAERHDRVLVLRASRRTTPSSRRRRRRGSGRRRSLTCLSIGSVSLNSRSATSQPSSADRAVAVDLRRADRPAALERVVGEVRGSRASRRAGSRSPSRARGSGPRGCRTRWPSRDRPATVRRRIASASAIVIRGLFRARLLLAPRS